MGRNIKLLIVLIVTGTIAGYILLVTIPTQLAKRSYEGARALGKDIRNAFQFTPEIKINNTVVLNQQTSVLELSVLEQSFEHRYVWENAWLGSTKKIFITGTFKAKVGFDLHKRFSIEMRENKAYVTLPSPRTLSVESGSDMTYRDEQGVWNWVSVSDRTRATNDFIRDARRFADQAPFVEDAKVLMTGRLEVLIQPYADEVIVTFEKSEKVEQTR